MTFLAPAFMIAAGAIAAAAVAIHFIVTREPRTVPLPTARFAPVRPVRARARRMRLQDLLLLLLRVLLILAVGAALAQPVLDPPRRALARIVLVDRSRAVAEPAEVADSVRALYSDGDALVLFDSLPTLVREGAVDSLAALARTTRRGRLSPALIEALRAASAMRASADSFELAIVSPIVAEEMDRATDSIRALWPGAVRLSRVAARPDSAAAVAPSFDGRHDDPLRLAFASVRDTNAAGPVRIVRGIPDAADTAWAGQTGHVLVHWPATDADARAAATALRGSWRAVDSPDTVGAVTAGEVVLVAPFERMVVYTDSAPARIVARWVDGTPAAVERTHGAGCIRTVAIGVPAVGDLVLQRRFGKLAQALTEPCEGRPSYARIATNEAASLVGSAPLHLAPASAFAPAETVKSPLVPWLLAAALLFAFGALLLQRRIAGAAITLGGGE